MGDLNDPNILFSAPIESYHVLEANVEELQVEQLKTMAPLTKSSQIRAIIQQIEWQFGKWQKRIRFTKAISFNQ